MVIAQEAPSTDKVISKDDILKLIPQYEIKPILLREHLNREIVAGTIGDRGGGKSGSDAVIGIVDFMLAGKKVWSNMDISCNIKIDDATARKYGLSSGGIAHYESLPIDKDALLKLDDNYRDGCLVIEEINVQYSNVRRFMSNTNVDFNEVCQQLRKFKVSMLYNVIDEMFIDPQLRALSDVFLRTYDTAFDLDALARKKPPGLDFCWQVYPMSGYLRGEQGRYALTHKTEKVFFHFGPWRGVYDSGQHQEKGRYSLNKREREKEEALKASYSVESSDEVKDDINRWQWLIDNVRKLRNSGIEYLEAHQMWQVLQVVEHGYTPRVIGSMLPNFGITRHHQNKLGQWVHRIEQFRLEDGLDKQTVGARGTI